METTILELPNGYSISAIQNSVKMIDEIWLDNYYDRDITIKPGMVIIDIGANQGFFSLYAASKGATVFAYEPEHYNFEIFKSNISRNNLKEAVFPFNVAIGKCNGKIDLYIQDYSIPFATGMVTSSKEYHNQVSNVTCGYIYDTQSVKCITLEALLKESHIDKVDLLKVDCEGNELDILLGASYETMKRIDALVMETHDSYPQRDLFHTIKRLGYSIVSYKKIEGAFSTGYLFARRSDDFSEQYRAPIAIIRDSGSCMKGETLTFDASDSFSTESEDTDLNYTWYLDGNIVAENKSVISLPFNSEGIYNLKLSISDLHGIDFIEKTIYVIDNSEFSEDNSILLDKVNQYEEFTIKPGISRFHVSRKSIAHNWDGSSFILRLTHWDYKVKLQGKVNILSKEWTLNGNYHEIFLNHFPVNKEMFFQLESPVEQKMIISFSWMEKPFVKTEKIITKDQEMRLRIENNIPEEVYLITHNDSIAISAFKGYKKLIIPKDLLPDFWKPEYIIIQVDNKNYQNEKQKESNDHFFEFESNTDHYSGSKIYLPSFTVPYCLFFVKITDSNQNIDFAITSGIERNISLTWWPYKAPQLAGA